MADHHLHLRTAAPAELGGGGTADAISAADALAALDAASIRQALVLSIAFRFGEPGVKVEDEYANVRRENDYVAEQVAKAPERLVGACSVNPLAAYALAEIDRCAADPRLAALKLHLANSGVDLNNEEHVEQLARLFRKLSELDLPAIVHLRTGAEDYGERDATIFVERVLSQAPRLPVQIAHMAGWGGYDEATDAALGVFVRALRDGRLERDLISFDLGAVVFLPEAAGEDLELARRVREANLQLAARIRELGLDRVVFATDWPSWPPVDDHEQKIVANVRLIEQALPLTAEELARLFTSVSSVMTHGLGESGLDPSE